LLIIKMLVCLSLLWAIVALAAQVLAARGGGRRDFSRAAGDPGRGLLYNFTAAMQPAHKESVRLYPGKFAVGLLMHLGAFAVLVGIVLLLIWPDVGRRALVLARPLSAIALLAGLFLLVRRFFSLDLRAMSAPDDFVANFATCVLLALAIAAPRNESSEMAFLIYAVVFLVYLPLGKLRHVVFFFVARGDYGRRLGYRGVYPPTPSGAE